MNALPSPSRVLIRKVTDLRAAVAEALDFLEYDFAGRRVWVKPNLLSPHAPEKGVTTDPELVRNVVRGLRRRGAAAIWVADNPAGLHREKLDEYLAPTGVVEAGEGCFRNIAESSVVLPLQSRFVSEIPVSAVIHEADVILNLPVLKTHALTIITGAVKNIFGIIPGGHKTYLHTVVSSAEEFAELLVDIYQAVPRPMLHIMDGLRGMDGPNGPSGGRVLRLNLLLSSANGVAVDAAMTMLAGGRPASIPTNRIAAARGLGPIEPGQIELVGDCRRIHGFRLPPARMAAFLTRASGLVYDALMMRVPVVDRKNCTRCGECVEGCPVRAISMTPYPRIDRRKCIVCYCCAEICPARAVTVARFRRGLLYRIFGR